MRFTISPFVVFMALMSGFVFTQNKEFCQSFVDNNYQFDSVITMQAHYRVFIIGREYWAHNNLYKNPYIKTKSRRLPDWFDSECKAFICFYYCDSTRGSLGCLKVSQFMSFFHMFVEYNESIDFRREVLRMALM